ncbi:MAG: hypothetical protein ACR2GZ_07080 [Solirubrobacteraceae bacterium]
MLSQGIRRRDAGPARARPVNPLGAKGIGESGTIGSTPAVENAVDALADRGARDHDRPVSGERVWRAVARTEAEQRGR